VFILEVYMKKINIIPFAREISENEWV